MVSNQLFVFGVSLGFICKNFVSITIKQTQYQKIIEDIENTSKISILELKISILLFSLLAVIAL